MTKLDVVYGQLQADHPTLNVLDRRLLLDRVGRGYGRGIPHFVYVNFEHERGKPYESA